MKIEKLKMQNFHCYENIELELKDDYTVLNGIFRKKWDKFDKNYGIINSYIKCYIIVEIWFSLFYKFFSWDVNGSKIIRYKYGKNNNYKIL